MGFFGLQGIVRLVYEIHLVVKADFLILIDSGAVISVVNSTWHL